MLPKEWTGWLPVIIAGLAVLAFIAIFLPAVSAKSRFGSHTGSLLDAPAGVKVLAIISMILVIAAAAVPAVAFFVRRKPLPLIYPIAGIAAGALGIITYIVMFIQVGAEANKARKQLEEYGYSLEDTGTSVGPAFGTFFGLVVFGLLLAAGVVALLMELKGKGISANLQPAFAGGSNGAGWNQQPYQNNQYGGYAQQSQHPQQGQHGQQQQQQHTGEQQSGQQQSDQSQDDQQQGEPQRGEQAQGVQQQDSGQAQGQRAAWQSPDQQPQNVEAKLPDSEESAQSEAKVSETAVSEPVASEPESVATGEPVSETPEEVSEAPTQAADAEPVDEPVVAPVEEPVVAPAEEPAKEESQEAPTEASGETVPAGASAVELQQLAATKPQLWEQIRQHPNCYPALAEWIKQAQSTN